MTRQAGATPGDLYYGRSPTPETVFRQAQTMIMLQQLQERWFGSLQRKRWVNSRRHPPPPGNPYYYTVWRHV